MTDDLGRDRQLAQGLLRLYTRALAEEHREVAEHLLCALEQLARSEPACGPILDRAYLRGTGGARNAATQGAARHRPPV